MKKVELIPKREFEYKYVVENLKINDTDLSYIISNYKNIDDEVMPFKDAFEKSWGRGFATLIILAGAEKIYLETEQVQGPPERFIGKL
ncbi:MAG: hypothetical protein H7Y04_13730 [Verrucomicrobia bacterium]|nr:hypothetical protein [Cytophagales bacterium]